jgi:hypothetical protein
MTGQTNSDVVPQVLPINPSKFPKGMIVLCSYLAYGFFSILLTFSLTPILLGPYNLGVPLGVIYRLVSIGLQGLSLIGALMRKKWARAVILGWFSFQIVYSFLQMIYSVIYSEGSITTVRSAVPKSTQFSDTAILLMMFIPGGVIIIVNTVVVWYVYRQKEFFNK